MNQTRFLCILGCILAFIPVGFAGCSLDGDSGGGKSADPSTWNANVQEYYFLTSVKNSEIKFDTHHCADTGAPPTVTYRLRGDSLEVGWRLYQYQLIGDTAYAVVDSFRMEGSYVRNGSGSSALGAWKLVQYGAWDLHSDTSAYIQEQIEQWNFVYADEELFLGPKIMLFAYPRFWISQVRYAEMRQRTEAGTLYRYVGSDSVLISRKGETVGLKYKPFVSFTAHSNSESHEPVAASLTDSCNYVGSTIDSTWVSPFLWDGTVFKTGTGNHSNLGKPRFQGRRGLR